MPTAGHPSTPTTVDALRKLAGHWPDRELAVSLNRMRCKTGDGETWTTVQVKEMRERLGFADYDPNRACGTMISLMKAAERLGICVGSAMSLVRRGILPATQIVPGSPWLVPVEALSSEPVRLGVQRVIADPLSQLTASHRSRYVSDLPFVRFLYSKYRYYDQVTGYAGSEQFDDSSLHMTRSAHFHLHS